MSDARITFEVTLMYKTIIMITMYLKYVSMLNDTWTSEEHQGSFLEFLIDHIVGGNENGNCLHLFMLWRKPSFVSQEVTWVSEEVRSYPTMEVPFPFFWKRLISLWSPYALARPSKPPLAHGCYLFYFWDEKEKPLAQRASSKVLEMLLLLFLVFEVLTSCLQCTAGTEII